MIGLGSMGRLNVGIAVHLRDEFSANAARVRQNMALLYGDADKVLQRNNRALGDVASTALTVGAGLSMFSFQAVRHLANYEKSVSALKAAIGTDMDMAFESLEKRIRSVAIESRYSIEETTMAATELARAGYKASQIYQMIGAATNLGQAGDIPITQAADALGRVLNTYDMASSSADMVASKVAVAANKSAASVPDLLEAMKYSGDILKSTGVPFNAALAMFGRLSSAGLRGSIAGTSVANMLRYLNKAATDLSTGKQSKALEMLGMGKGDLLDENGQLKQLIGVDGKAGLLDTLGAKLRSLDPSRAQAIAEALTGVRGERALVPLMEITKNTRDIQDLYRVIEAAPDTAAESISQKMMDNLWGDLEKLKENFQALMITFAQNKGLRGLVQMLTRMVELTNAVMESPAGNFFGRILFYAGPMLLFMGSLVWSIQKFTRFTGLAREGMAGLFKTMAHNRNLSLSNFFGGVNSGAQGLANQNIRVNSMGVPYMGPGGGSFGGVNYRGGSFLQAQHRAAVAPYISGLQQVQAASMGATVGTTGFAGSMSRTAGIASRAMGIMGIAFAAITPLMDLLQGNIGGGIGGILGGIIGFLAGGPMGAVVGSTLGSGVGSMFDTSAGEDVNFEEVSQNTPSFKVRPDGAIYLGQPSQPSGNNATFQNNINVNVDGYNAFSKRYEGENNESIYQSLGAY